MQDLINQMHDKYMNLVWYARKHPKGDAWWDTQPIEVKECVYAAMDDVEADYPEETAQLNSQQSGDWTHGFNSGMLAAIRLVMCAEEFGTEQALELFPELDT